MQHSLDMSCRQSGAELAGNVEGLILGQTSDATQQGS